MSEFRQYLTSALLGVTIAACSSGVGSTTTMVEPTTTTVAPVGLALTLVADGLEYPVSGAALPGTNRIFVVERLGRIVVFEDWRRLAEPALDIVPLVFIDGWETGMLGIALHPDFDANGRVFVTFTSVDDEALVLAEFTAFEPGGARFDPDSYRELLRVEQPGRFHQGGTIRFGPDGYLWVGLGDGGSGDDDPEGRVQDRFGHGQNPHTLQGTLVRVDVDGGEPYGIPAYNPFVQGGGAPEVWAYGVRNPWSLSFDGDRLFVADVGHVQWEEVTLLSLDGGAGANLGWSVMEGPECFAGTSCYDLGFVEPLIILPRPDLCAVIGGPVYRGDGIPEAVGEYFYADLCSGWVRSALVDDGILIHETIRLDATESVPSVTAFLVDQEGEMYLMTYSGAIYLIGHSD